MVHICTLYLYCAHFFMYYLGRTGLQKHGDPLMLSAYYDETVLQGLIFPTKKSYWYSESYLVMY